MHPTRRSCFTDLSFQLNLPGQALPLSSFHWGTGHEEPPLQATETEGWKLGLDPSCPPPEPGRPSPHTHSLPPAPTPAFGSGPWSDFLMAADTSCPVSLGDPLWVRSDTPGQTSQRAPRARNPGEGNRRQGQSQSTATYSVPLIVKQGFSGETVARNSQMARGPGRSVEAGQGTVCSR